MASARVSSERRVGRVARVLLDPQRRETAGVRRLEEAVDDDRVGVAEVVVDRRLVDRHLGPEGVQERLGRAGAAAVVVDRVDVDVADEGCDRLLDLGDAVLGQVAADVAADPQVEVAVLDQHADAGRVLELVGGGDVDRGAVRELAVDHQDGGGDAAAQVDDRSRSRGHPVVHRGGVGVVGVGEAGRRLEVLAAVVDRAARRQQAVGEHVLQMADVVLVVVGGDHVVEADHLAGGHQVLDEADHVVVGGADLAAGVDQHGVAGGRDDEGRAALLDVRVVDGQLLGGRGTGAQEESETEGEGKESGEAAEHSRRRLEGGRSHRMGLRGIA